MHAAKRGFSEDSRPGIPADRFSYLRSWSSICGPKSESEHEPQMHDDERRYSERRIPRSVMVIENQALRVNPRSWSFICGSNSGPEF
jgi:hypothetical protein